MLSDIRDYYGLVREISQTGQTGYFETAQLQQILKELKLAIKDGKLIALSGIVGTGKTTILQKSRSCSPRTGKSWWRNRSRWTAPRPPSAP